MDHISPIVEDHAMFGMCIKTSHSGAPPILCLVRGDSTTRPELQRVADLDKNGVDFMNDDADQSSWFFFATTYRIIWGLKSSRGNTLVDTMPMKADGLRMTTSEHDEVFAKQEQQSDESEPPRHVDYNADSLAPIRESCLLQHSGPEENEQDYTPILEKDAAQLQDLQSLNQENPNLQGKMAEYRPSRAKAFERTFFSKERAKYLAPCGCRHSSVEYKLACSSSRPHRRLHDGDRTSLSPRGPPTKARAKLLRTSATRARRRDAMSKTKVNIPMPKEKVSMRTTATTAKVGSPLPSA